MARVCEISGRKTRTGNRIQHRRGKSGSGGAWNYKAPKTKRTWKPNLRKVKVNINGTTKRIKVSMKEYKKMRKESEALAN
ncbi:50S ribosomal protein L28 [Candidatus Dojkabacteria bacterium]|uniref:Large ribosomal subunit protein bL28 n=1 Tax=Candidatus Dojkabacteria bacterium TaxID=2099670 RepID=A0A955LAB8_9BACT|nr:50S ribosomal protein L28 [Candidatus Dojkabacteria bacterium]